MGCKRKTATLYNLQKWLLIETKKPLLYAQALAAANLNGFGS